jgi:hypothetical protein
MSLYTHWACFACRKSFHNVPADHLQAEVQIERKCPDCGEVTYDFGVYFQPPRRQAKRTWAIMKLLAGHNYRFQTEGSVAFINQFILAGSRTSLKAVCERIERELLAAIERAAKTRLQQHKQEKLSKRW